MLFVKHRQFPNVLLLGVVVWIHGEGVHVVHILYFVIHIVYV
jgi:hypothetical protein